MMPGFKESSSARHDGDAARSWLGFAAGSLIFAGLFALAVVIGRMPPFDRFVTDPLFFKRCLVAHVNLSLVVFMYAFICSLLFLLPGRERARGVARGALPIAVTGVVFMLIGAGVPGSQPVLANYVPTIDHWVFRTGQALFGLGIVTSLLDLRLFLPASSTPERESEPDPSASGLVVPASARAGLRAAACALLLAGLTFVIAAFKQPVDVDAIVYYELLAWGGGHVLQLVCVIAMVSVWLILITSALGASPVSGKAAAVIFFALIMPWLYAPFLALGGTATADYRTGFTTLMRWCIFPMVAIFFILCVSALFRAVKEGRIEPRQLARDLRISGFLASSGLTLLGFCIGAFIRASNTMVPAHYHASVGGVTVAFMTVTYLMLAAFSISIPTPRLCRLASWQPALYGSGMALFACGFAFAGAHGMGRKMYGAEQAARGLAETFGLTIMGLGGLVSIAGGLLFLVIVSAAWWRGTELCSQPKQEFLVNSWR